jgi:transcriptional regulator of arginine metabolism
MRVRPAGVNPFFCYNPPRMKKIRHKAILELVRGQPIGSQEELLENLLARNIDVSQSTLSRDIQELRLAKAGGVYVVTGQEQHHASNESVRRILREFLTDTAVAQNMVVLKTGNGHASTVSQAIDEAGWPEVVGSIAGENTVFLAFRSPKDSRKVEQRILEFLK